MVFLCGMESEMGEDPVGGGPMLASAPTEGHKECGGAGDRKGRPYR